MAHKILIADDEPMITELLSKHLQDNGYTPLVAQNSEEVIARLNLYPNMILLDINMPGMDGLELCKVIRDHVTCPILFLTARITEQDKINGLRAGGDDYIIKPFSLQELTARIEAHLRRDGRNKRPPEVVTSQGLIINLSARNVFWNEQELSFSKREFDIIEFLSSNQNQVFDKERIYEAVWGYDAEGDSSVVKEHIRKIRAKFRDITGHDYIETVWGMGYRWRK